MPSTLGVPSSSSMAYGESIARSRALIVKWCCSRVGVAIWLLWVRLSQLSLGARLPLSDVECLAQPVGIHLDSDVAGNSGLPGAAGQRGRQNDLSTHSDAQTFLWRGVSYAEHDEKLKHTPIYRS